MQLILFCGTLYVVLALISNILVVVHCLPVWASYQIRKLWVVHAPGMPGTFSPLPRVANMTCITARARLLSDKKPMCFLSDCGHVRAVMPARIANSRVPFKSVAEKMILAFPAHAQPAILRIW